MALQVLHTVSIPALAGIRLCWAMLAVLVLAASVSPHAAATVFDDGFEGNAERVAEISQFGITWTFDREYPAGRFANGDWWVVGPLTIIAIDPPSLDVGGRVRNGSMLNPVPADPQAYDSHATDRYPYDLDLNVAFNVSAGSPLVLAAGSSLVSSTTKAEPDTWPQLDDAAVLTVLDVEPPPGSFRPPYSGDDKTVRFNVDQLDRSLLQNLTPVAQTPEASVVAASLERPWIDHIRAWLSQAFLPENNMPNYGREIAAIVGRASLLLHVDLPPEQKEPLLIRLVQLGIDNYGVATQGTQNLWAPDGGHNQGRKWPILFAALMLDDPEMRAIGSVSGEYLYASGHGPGDAPPDYIHFGEDGQIFHVRETAPGEIHYGCEGTGYAPQHLGMPEWSFRYSVDPCQADADWFANNYRRCCTANSFVGFLLAARLMGAVELWNHDALFEYQDRYMGEEQPGSWQRAWDKFSENMWDTYRDQAP